MNLKNKLLDKTWKKCIIIFVVIFLCVLIGGFFSINYLHDVVTNNHIHTDDVVIVDKMYGDSEYSDYYLVVGDNNKTYSIVNHEDGYGQKMFDKIQVGNKYKLVVKEPELLDINQFTHILQVYNGTS